MNLLYRVSAVLLGGWLDSVQQVLCGILRASVLIYLPLAAGVCVLNHNEARPESNPCSIYRQPHRPLARIIPKYMDVDTTSHFPCQYLMEDSHGGPMPSVTEPSLIRLLIGLSSDPFKHVLRHEKM